MNESKATRYQRGRRRAQAAGAVSGGAVLVLLALTPAGARLAAWAESLAAGWPRWLAALVALTAFTGLVALLWEAAWLPALWYLSTRVDARYGRGVALGDLLAAQAQAAVLAALLALTAAAVVQVSAAVAGAWWWAASGASIGLLLATALHGTPRWLARATGATLLDRPALEERLGSLARRVRVPIASIDVLPDGATVTETALVAGAGQQRRVFIAAELMRDWSDEEIAVVVAHELAHHAHHHLWQTLVVDVGLLSGGLWLADASLAWLGRGGAGPGDLTSLPVIALVACGTWLVTAPARHALSRRQERQADVFALALTGSGDAFQAAIRRLAARHLAEEHPSRLTRWLYHRHPSVAERTRIADAFQRRG